MTDALESTNATDPEDSPKNKGSKPQSTVYAGFWWRLATFLIDFALVFLVAALLAALTTKISSSMGASVPRWLALLILALVSWLYYAGFESSSWRATLGKRLLGLRVTDVQGKRISFARASLRSGGRMLSWGLCLGGYLMMIPHKKKQTLHDRLTQTVVLRKLNAAPVLRLFSWMPLHQRNIFGRNSTAAVAVVCLLAIGALMRMTAVAMEPQILAGNARSGAYQAVSEAKKAQDYVAAQIKETGHFPPNLPDQVAKGIQVPGGSELRYSPQTGYIYIYFSANPYLAGRYISLAPIKGRTGLIWACSAFGIEPALVPKECRLR